MSGALQEVYANFRSSGAATYIEDVFSTWLYTGNGSTQTITNGIDLSGKGGMTWIKSRSNATENLLYDTSRGAFNYLISSSTGAQSNGSPTGLSAFNTTGFDVAGTTIGGGVNGSGATYASWTFRKQPKFFDIVTYTGTGANQTIAHNLGSTPGCIIVKCTSNNVAWNVYHRSLTSAAYQLELNTTSAQFSDPTIWNSTAPTSSVFSVGTNLGINGSGRTYVAYLFAHDAGGFGATGTDNVISCGSFTTNSAGVMDVNLGYEPQYILYKSSSTATNWNIIDSMRGLNVSQGVNLYADATAAESTSPYPVQPTATGFKAGPSPLSPLSYSQTYIYIAIRRPMKTPTTGTEVFGINTYSGTGAEQNINSSFNAPSAALSQVRSASGWSSPIMYDRLRGKVGLATDQAAAEIASAAYGASVLGNTQTQEIVGNFGSSSGKTYVTWSFLRAPGFFDEVCYTGGTANIPTTVTISGQTFGRVTHNLGVTPELIIIKSRTRAVNWIVGSSLLGQGTFGKNAWLNLTNAPIEGGFLPLYNEQTSSYITVNNNIDETGLSGATYVAYLFATVAGVSKVGSYTGTGATLNINAGFTTGARFVMIKRTDSTGNWFVWDTARGMVSGTDPRLALNTSNAETNADWVYTASSGFQIVTTDASVNASGGTYIYLAIA